VTASSSKETQWQSHRVAFVKHDGSEVVGGKEKRPCIVDFKIKCVDKKSVRRTTSKDSFAV